MIRRILAGVCLASLLAAPATAGPIASFSQVTPNSSPFEYVNATGAFSASTDVNFNFLVDNSSGVTGTIAAVLTLSGQTTGPVTQIGQVLLEDVATTSFSLIASAGPLAGQNLLSGTFSGVIGGGGTSGLELGSEGRGDTVAFTSAFLYDLGGGLTSLSGASVSLRDASFALSGITPPPLTQFNSNLSGTPAGTNFRSSIAGVFAAVPEPATVLMTGLGLAGVALVGLRARRR